MLEIAFIALVVVLSALVGYTIGVLHCTWSQAHKDPTYTVQGPFEDRTFAAKQHSSHVISPRAYLEEKRALSALENADQ